MDTAQGGNPENANKAWPLEYCSRRGGLVVSALLTIVGGAFAAQALTLPFGNLDLPGPGFFPFVLGLLLMALSIAIFIQIIRDPAKPPRIALGHGPVLITFLGLGLTAFAFERLGALLSLGVFSAAMLVFVGRVRIVPAVLSSTVGMLAVWYVFKVLLGVQLPLGLLVRVL